MNLMPLACAQIRVEARKRPVDRQKVLEIAKSIEQQGLLQPIGVQAVIDEDGSYRLVYGAHRLLAMQHLERSEIDAYVLPEEWTDDECLLAELQENCARNDLNGTQRKGYAAEIGRLCQKLALVSNGQILTDGWMTEIGHRMGLTRQTLYNWWHTFCEENGLTLTPRQALAIHRERFFAWLDAQQIKADEERQRKAEAAERAERETYLHGLHAEVEEAILLYGWDLVYATVLAPVLEDHDA